MKNKIMWIGITVALVLAIVSLFLGGKTTQIVKENVIGGSTNYGALGLSDLGDGNGTFTLAGGSKPWTITASTTGGGVVCSIYIPTRTVLDRFSFSRTLSTSSVQSLAESFYLATATSATATTSPIARWDSSSGSTTPFYGEFFASTTATRLVEIKAGSYLNLDWQLQPGYGATNYGGSGYCGLQGSYLERL